MYRADNTSVYHYIEEATRSTHYAPTVQTLSRTKDGRAAWLSLLGQHAGRDKWEKDIKAAEEIMHTRKWKGQTAFTLESFISQHRNSYVSMTVASEHVPYQLPNEYTRVGYLLDGIECSDAGVQAALNSVRTSDDPDTGTRFDFERTAAHLIPYCPVAKKRASSGNKRGAAQISAVDGEGEVGSTPGKKDSIGKTGVHLRWYEDEEYAELSKAQKDELRTWRENNPNFKPTKGKKGKGNKKQKHVKKNLKKQVAALVAEQVKEKLEEATSEAQAENDGEAYIASLIDAALAKRGAGGATAAATTSSQTKKVSIKSILKNARNQPST